MYLTNKASSSPENERWVGNGLGLWEGEHMSLNKLRVMSALRCGEENRNLFYIVICARANLLVQGREGPMQTDELIQLLNLFVLYLVSGRETSFTSPQCQAPLHIRIFFPCCSFV